MDALPVAGKSAIMGKGHETRSDYLNLAAVTRVTNWMVKHGVIRYEAEYAET